MVRKYLVLAFFISISLSCFSQLRNNIAPINPEFIKYKNSLKSGLKSASIGQNFGYTPPFTELPEYYTNSTSTSSQLSTSLNRLPAVFDLRTINGVTPVKNQGTSSNGGNCWAFSTMGSIESNWKYFNYGEYDLSEKNLATCHGFVWGFGQGGNFQMVVGYLARLKGPVSENSAPYDKSPYTCESGKPVVAYSPDARWIYYNKTLIKQAIIDYGAVTTPIFMSSTYLTKSDHTYYYNGTESDNHAVLIVGWDDNKATKGGKGAWIAKNSWGGNSEWIDGDDGYFYISYKTTQILNPVTYYPSHFEKSEISKAYYYDEAGLVSFYGYQSDKAIAITKYTSAKPQYIKKVGTFLAMTGSIAKIDIYASKSGDTLKNLLSTYTSLPVRCPGFYTFDTPTKIDSVFYIRMEYYTPGFKYPIPIEIKEDGYVDPLIQVSGKQWISKDGNKLQPLGYDIKDWQANLIIHAYTTDNLGPKANFDVDKFEACPKSTILFTNKSIGNYDSCKWSLTLGTLNSDTSRSAVYTHVPLDPQVGIGYATLVLYSKAGNDSIKKEYKFTNYLNPVIASPSSIKRGDTAKISVIADGSSFEWKPADLLINSTGKEVLFTSQDTGLYKFRVKVVQGTCVDSSHVAEIKVKNPPKNDDVCNAIELTIGGSDIIYTNINASAQYNEPYPTDTCCDCPMTWCNEGGVQNSVWFKFIAPSSGKVSIDSHGFDDQIAVYSSNNCDSIKKADLVAANDDYYDDNAAFIDSVKVIPGKTYWVQVDGSAGGAQGYFTITLSDLATSVPTISSKSKMFNIFPNPNNGKFNLNCILPVSDNLQIDVLDITGKNQNTILLKVSPGNINYPLALTGLKSGIYFLNLKGEKYSETVKVIVY